VNWPETRKLSTNIYVIEAVRWNLVRYFGRVLSPKQCTSTSRSIVVDMKPRNINEGRRKRVINDYIFNLIRIVLKGCIPFCNCLFVFIVIAPGAPVLLHV
jgi:hypothetical protein